MLVVVPLKLDQLLLEIGRCSEQYASRRSRRKVPISRSNAIFLNRIEASPAIVELCEPARP
jgi:hypothetical protein